MKAACEGRLFGCTGKAVGTFEAKDGRKKLRLRLCFWCLGNSRRAGVKFKQVNEEVSQP